MSAAQTKNTNKVCLVKRTCVGRGLNDKKPTAIIIYKLFCKVALNGLALLSLRSINLCSYVNLVRVQFLPLEMNYVYSFRPDHDHDHDKDELYYSRGFIGCYACRCPGKTCCAGKTGSEREFRKRRETSGTYRQSSHQHGAPACRAAEQKHCCCRRRDAGGKI